MANGYRKTRRANYWYIPTTWRVKYWPRTFHGDRRNYYAPTKHGGEQQANMRYGKEPRSHCHDVLLDAFKINSEAPITYKLTDMVKSRPSGLRNRSTTFRRLRVFYCNRRHQVLA